MNHYVHKRFAKLIHAWADGAQIQYRCRTSGKWRDCQHNMPRWVLGIKYRVKEQT